MTIVEVRQQDLIRRIPRVTWKPMKFTLAFVVYLIIGTVIGLGILQALHGVYWLLIASVLAYIIGFAWIGCLHH